MAPRNTAASASVGSLTNPQEKWVKVTWMPHTTLSQTSHVCLSVRSAHAVLDPLEYHGTTSEQWRVRVSLFAVGGLELLPISTSTANATLESRKQYTLQDNDLNLRPSVTKATHECCWDAFVQIPIRWRDLPRDSYLQFAILRQRDIVLYEATMPFFSLYGRLATGLQKIELERPPLANDRNYGVHEVQSQNQISCSIAYDDEDNPVWKASCILDQLERFEERACAPNKGERLNCFGQVQSVPWLDALTKERSQEVLIQGSTMSESSTGDSLRACLIIELPHFDIPIMHEETFYPTPQTGPSGAVTPLDLALYEKHKATNKIATVDSSKVEPLAFVHYLDYESENDNPVEDKYRTLAHDLLRGLVDPALKPDREQRDRLAAVIDSTSFHPTREEKDLLWRFRFSLVNNRRALTKFLLAVDWTVDSEVVQAAELLEQWRKRSPIEVTDALKLLGRHVAFQTNLVRSYAIDTLAAAPDSELRLYLLQLVQALKYETMEVTESDNALSSSTSTSRLSSLASFLIERAVANIELANFLYWYLKVELNNQTHGARYREVFEALKANLSATAFHLSGLRQTEKSNTTKSFKSIVDKIGTSILGTDADKDRSSNNTEKRTMWDVIVAQDDFISGLLRIQQQCRDARGKKDAKEEQLQALLVKEGFDRSASRKIIPLPISPDIFVNGVNPKTAKVFKSALYPALIDFHVEATMKNATTHQAGQVDRTRIISLKHNESVTSFKVIVKTGDDLRQDQLIMMMIQLMDRLLKRAALDLCLTPYSILATSSTSGLVEFVEGSMPISQILYQHSGSILQFFQSKAPHPGAKYEVQASVMSTYVRSCAGYCVITYILGVGDRHLDNILLRASGHFFHIDFGFIFGRDPKPLPLAFRLTREMVDGMGGTDSTEYRQFCSLACQAFNSLRKSAGLILNLLHLMSDAGIEDLSNNPAANAEGVIAKVEERFRLDLSDEQAERYFIGLINDCLSALAPRVMDVFHSFAVARR